MPVCDSAGSDNGEGRLSAAVVVAHPDDETLWAGGTILMHPRWHWTVVALCRASDPDRAPKFRRTIEQLGAKGAIADLDDGPEQTPLAEDLVSRTIASSLPPGPFDVVLTHSPCGEYTHHRRHEETGRAVLRLWENGGLKTGQVWLFAYEDGGGRYPPRAITSAQEVMDLPEEIWSKKYEIITHTYGFREDGFEAKAAPRVEAFWRFATPAEAHQWLSQRGQEP